MVSNQLLLTMSDLQNISGLALRPQIEYENNIFIPDETFPTLTPDRGSFTFTAKESQHNVAF